MNIPITREQAYRLFPIVKQSFLYGSRLFDTHTPESDYDMVMLYNYDDMFDENYFLPNLHSFQYTDVQNNKDINFLTYEQFWTAFYNGDGTMYADIIMFSRWFDNVKSLQMCRTYKIIKGYCGAAKRDLTTSGKIDKVVKRSAKNLYIAECLISNIFPDMKIIQSIFKSEHNIKQLLEFEKVLRKNANDLFNSNDIGNYFIINTDDDLLNIMLQGNNMKEYNFKK